MEQYCGNCSFLSLTEEEQAEKRKVAKANKTYLKNKEDFHYCRKYGNQRVLHKLEHPLLPRLDECLKDTNTTEGLK